MAETEAIPNPAETFMQLIVAFLAPMFLSVSGGDINLAQAAAREAVAAYRGRHQPDLLSIAQIVAFGLTTLSSLSLSMRNDLSLPMMLRLRANAASLNRAAEQCRRALRQSASAEPTAHQDPDPVYNKPAEPDQQALLARIARLQRFTGRPGEAVANPPPAAQPPMTVSTPPPAAEPDRIETPVHQHNTAWAAGLVRAARKVTTGLDDLPPNARLAAAVQASAMAAAARDLLSLP